MAPSRLPTLGGLDARLRESQVRLDALARRRRGVDAEPPPDGWTIPLAALQVRLDTALDVCEWSVDPDGVDGRALVQSVLGAPRFGVSLERPILLTATARLLPHDWLNGVGRAWPRVIVVGPSGRETEVWSGTVAAASAGGSPEGITFTCTLPAWTRELVLRVDRPPIADGRAVGRVAWVLPRLVDPHVTPPPPPPPAAGPTSRVGHDPPLEPPRDATDPLFSVLVPVHDPPIDMLHEAVDSVRAQTFTDWELCMVDDGSGDPEVIAALREYADADPRIRVARHERARGISAATNSALALAGGAYIVLLDHDDMLVPDALELVAARVSDDPTLDMLYSDETIVAHGRAVTQALKPGWSPETLCSLMYTCHLGVYRRSVAEQAGGFDSGYDGCQDYDFALRVTELTDRVAHIDSQLYHWRAHEASTASGDGAKPYAYVIQPRAIAEHLLRTGVDASVEFGPVPGQHRIVHRGVPTDDVAIVSAVGDLGGLAEAAATWAPTECRVVLVAPDRIHGPLAATLAEAGVSPERTTLLEADVSTDPVRALDHGARSAAVAGAGQLILLEEPFAGITADWPARLVGYSRQPRITAAGPALLGADGRVRTAGIAIPDGMALPLLHAQRGAAAGSIVQNVAAVGGVLATSAAVYAELGGLRHEYRGLALVDYCLRGRLTGRRTVIVADTRLQAIGPDRTVNDIPALQRLHAAWRDHGDPYYNSAFRSDHGDYTPRIRL